MCFCCHFSKFRREVWCLYIFLQEIGELPTGDFSCAKTEEMLGGHLAVNQLKTSFIQMCNQMDKRRF